MDGGFSCNSTIIYDGENFFDYDAYEGSLWATPILIVEYEDGSNESFDCWYRQIEVESEDCSENLLIE